MVFGISRSERQGTLSAKYSFKCSKRTQEVSLETFTIEMGEPLITGRRGKSGYQIAAGTETKINIAEHVLLKNGFLIDEGALLLFGGDNDVYPLAFVPFQTAQAAIQQELTKTLYLGPFRQPPERRYASRGAAPSEVGPLGEATITMLANEMVQSRTRPHLGQIAGWLAHMKLARGIDVNRIGSSDLFNVNLTLSDGNKFPIADLGYGLSQVLPVLTQCSFAPEGATLLFEQPELHVHPLATKGLSKVFIDTVRNKKAHICLETHSPDLLRSFFKAVKDGELTPDELQVYSVRRNNGKTILKSIDVDEYGDNYENWEKDLCFE